MKLKAYLKLTVKGIIKQRPLILLTYGIFPIILALSLGYIERDDFSSKMKEPIFSIKILDQDNTPESKGLINYLESDDIAKLIKIENNSKDIDYTVKIPKGYSKSLKKHQDIDIPIELSKDASTSKANILVNLVDSYNREMTKSLLIQRNIKNSNIEVGDLNMVFSDINSTKSIKTEIYKVEKTLTSYERHSILFLGFVFIWFISAIITADNLGKEINLENRILSTGISKVEYFNLEFISNYIMMVVINSIYIFIFRIFNFSFQGSILLLCLIILLQSLVITLIGSLIVNIFTKKYGIIITQAYLMFYVAIEMIIKGTKLIDMKIFEILSKYKPDKILSDVYRNYIIYNDFESIGKYLLIIATVSVVLYLINLASVKRKWGLR